MPKTPVSALLSSSDELLQCDRRCRSVLCACALLSSWLLFPHQLLPLLRWGDSVTSSLLPVLAPPPESCGASGFILNVLGLLLCTGDPRFIGHGARWRNHAMQQQGGTECELDLKQNLVMHAWSFMISVTSIPQCLATLSSAVSQSLNFTRQHKRGSLHLVWKAEALCLFMVSVAAIAITLILGPVIHFHDTILMYSVCCFGMDLRGQGRWRS